MDKHFNLLVTLVQGLPEQPAVRPAFEREHIFHAILQFCCAAEGMDAQMDMMYHFSLYQNLLRAIRTRSEAGIQYWQEKIQASPLRIHTDNARDGMQALYFPVLGNKAYLEKNYQQAQGHQQQAMIILARLFNNGLKVALVARFEQYLNLFRVAWAGGQHAHAIGRAVNLLGFLYTAQPNAVFEVADLTQIFGAAELSDLVDFYSDSIIAKLAASADGSELAEFFRRMAKLEGQYLSVHACLAFQLLADLCAKAPPLASSPALAIPGDFCLQSLPGSVQMALLLALRQHCFATAAAQGAVHSEVPNQAAIKLKIEQYCAALPGYAVFENFFTSS